jgi:hypothetical protein
LLPEVTTIDDIEAQKMARLLDDLQRPYGTEHYELIRSGYDGTYWQAPSGLIVRLAAAEAVREAECVARALLDLAVRYASGQ